jgi:apolipoprotein N-acyltransferase
MNTCLGLLGVCCGVHYIRHLAGRRVVRMIGYMACGFCFLYMAIGERVKAPANAAGDAMVAFVAVYMFFYTGCLNLTNYVLATELVISTFTVWTVGSATSLGCLLSWVTLFDTPYFINPQDIDCVGASLRTHLINISLILMLHHNGTKYRYIWAGLNFIYVIFYTVFIPETRDRSFEDWTNFLRTG